MQLKARGLTFFISPSEKPVDNITLPFSTSFVQIYTNTACRIGCGKAECGGGSKRIHVCAFAIGMGADYWEGKPCADCPSTCSNNLCGEWTISVVFEMTFIGNLLENVFYLKPDLD